MPLGSASNLGGFIALWSKASGRCRAGPLDLHTHCLILRSLLRRAPSVPATTRSGYLYLLSDSGDLGILNGELKAKRKPRGLPRMPGVPQLRSADWQSAATLLQQPPRYTRSEPTFGPVGFLTAPLG